MSIIDDIKIRAKYLKKVIVLPESEDERIVASAVKATREGIADIILIGSEDKIKEIHSFDFEDIKFIDPENYEKTKELIDDFY